VAPTAVFCSDASNSPVIAVNSVTGKQHRSSSFEFFRASGCADLAALMQLNSERYPFLLQSVTAGPKQARFDILFGFPGETLQLTAEGVSGPSADKADGSFLAALDRWWSAETSKSTDGVEPESDLPFTGGWFLYLGYELAAEVEPGLQLSKPDDMPVAFATRVPVAIINDRNNNETIVIAEPEAADCLASVREDIAAAVSVSVAPTVDDPVGKIVEEPPEEFLAAVARAKQYIREGDIFQANLSRRWRAQLNEVVAPVELYRRLCETNPAPFAGMIVMDDYAVISSSPERLVKRSGRRIDTRPIAGTRPRTEGAEMTEGMMDVSREELLGNPKERAEHIMLIDLERNDLGRVCVGGSVEVDEYMVVESYTHVHHIVSNVTGTARPDLTPGELIRAVFPGGTITGCPKVRCMEIIQELEGRPRGAYTGSMGYLNKNGDCDLNILIRTMTLRGRQIELAAGSGVVADSDPQTELNETRAKAKGMILALREQHDREQDG
jgi:anthranilate synthase component 1